MDANATTQSVTLLRGVGNLIKLLPTGTVFFYQLMNPVVSNYGHCHLANKILTAIFVGFNGFFCLFFSFTDSYTGADGKTHYALVTHKGLWPVPTDETIRDNNARYRLRFGDFVHAFLSLVVFVLVVLFDKNSVDCFFPSLESQKKLLVVLPTVVGFVSSVGLAISMPTRNWFGYPSQ